MVETRLNGHRAEREAERIAHLVGGRLAEGVAVASALPERIEIGRYRLRGLPRMLGGPGPIEIEATARPRSDAATVWLTRTAPGPLRTIGYVLRADARGARYHSYVPDLPEEAAAVLCDHACDLWAEAERRGEVSAERATGPVRLELTVIDGLRVDLTWEPGGDAVALAFRDLEPEHLGTVTGLDGTAPRLYPTPTHVDWATEPGRLERLTAAAADAYHRRPGSSQ
ncbi:hypothetical protein [Glycomyces arizonensis]|uniref:hypothetical protein n=1 Tax=Glycomyces arizonensis TaxID=256035 RepID=UPI000424773C|nr:hypothetical protein [Glycomyces arizonensis]